MKKAGLRLPTPSELQDRHVHAAGIQKKNVYDHEALAQLSLRRRQDLEDLKTIPNIAKARLKAQADFAQRSIQTKKNCQVPACPKPEFQER